EEGDEVALHVLGPVQAEAGKAQVLRQAPAVQATAAVVEHGRVVGQLPGLAVGHLVQAYRAAEAQAQVEEGGAEARARQVVPERPLRAGAQGVVLLPAQRRHRRMRDLAARRVRPSGEGTGMALEPGVVEAVALAQRGRRGGGGQGREQAGGGERRAGTDQELASVHGASVVWERAILSMLKPQAGLTRAAQRWQRGHQTVVRWPTLAWRRRVPQAGQGRPPRPYTASSCSK